MKLKDVMVVVNITLSSALFGAGTIRMIIGDYKTATFILFVVAILYAVGYFTERWST